MVKRLAGHAKYVDGKWVEELAKKKAPKAKAKPKAKPKEKKSA